MSHTIRYEFAALGCVEFTVVIKQVVHEAALELCQTLFLRHLVIEFVNLLVVVFYCYLIIAACEGRCG